jgi:hypothetical protein
MYLVIFKGKMELNVLKFVKKCQLSLFKYFILQRNQDIFYKKKLSHEK